MARTLKQWPLSWLVILALPLAACDDKDSETGSTKDAGEHSDSEEHKKDAGHSAPDTADKGNLGTGANKAPTTYPAQWNTVFVEGNPLPEGFQFGREKKTLEKGETFGMQKLALPCDVEWERDIPVTLRDGTVIYLDVLTPPNHTDKLPAIVAWSPYGKTLPTNGPTSVPPEWFSGIAKFEGPDAAFWICHDYAIVNVDVRGAFKSGGDLQVFGEVDAGDGYDVIEWIAEQPWSNGSVGMHGASWLSMAQWNIAATNPPHLKAISPWNGQSDIYRNSLVQGGIPDTEFSNRVGSRLVSENMVESTVKRLADHPLYDDYWADKRPKIENFKGAVYVGADIATALHTAGTIDGFRRLGTKDKWLRVNNTNEWYDQYTPENLEDLLLFFDHFLKGKDNDWTKTPRVRVAVMDPGEGGGDKVNVPYESWPLPDTEYRKFYLSAEKDAADKGKLTDEAPADAVVAKYDAENGETTFTMTFEEDTQIVGHAIAHLFVEADGNDDMDVFALVEKLDKDDTSLIPSPLAMTYFPMPPPGVPGRLRASMRELDKDKSTDFLPVHKLTDAQKLKKGEVVELNLAMMPTALRWHKGQKLKLTIAGTYVRGSGLPLTTLNKGTHIIHSGGDHASYLQLPVVPWTK
ncbi:MAG TPA: CocE/NonD family hydrolase [Polyangiales bacterium]|nr:CocE/NonD family hydrolase [Polyangiales bacterium]